jgi:CPA2 family monovalent cation:H+ antiporter-2
VREPALLRDLVILIAVAIPVVVAAHRARIPTVVGFLLTGMVIGPHGLGLVRESASVEALAELGAVLLLFTVGLELSLSRMLRMGRVVLQGGSFQVILTLALAAVGLAGTGTPFSRAVFAGALVALSSTAIVLKAYAERGELDTPHGRVAVGILLFQDLAVVPLMLLVPILAGGVSQGGEPGGVGGAALRGVLGATLVVGGLVVGGRLVVPWLLEQLVRLRNREIFTLAVLFLGLAAALLTSSFGLSLALGSFLAGLVISESEFGLQALSDVLPFRDAFSGIFFTAVGMLLDLGFVVDHAGLVGGSALLLLLLKTGVVAIVVLTLGRSLHVGLLTGLGLAQVGEFSFVLAGAGLARGLLQDHSYQVFLGAAVLSMLAAPFLIAAADPVARLVERVLGLGASRAPAGVPGEAKLSDHTIVVGYGLNGRNVARALAAAEIPYVILEQNGPVVRRARLQREPIHFGDGTRAEVLERVGIARARVVVFVIASAAEERRGVAVARHLNPRARIIVRTRYVAEVEELQRLGADEVVPEEFETSLEIFARVLRHYAVPPDTIRREIEQARADHYEMLREQEPPVARFEGAAPPLGVRVALDTITIENGAGAIGHNPVTMSLRRATGSTLIAVIRDNAVLYTPDPAFRFRAGDQVVLVGTPEALERGAKLFRAEPGTA